MKTVVLIQIGEKVPFSDNVRLMRTANFAINFAEFNPESKVIWYGSSYDHYSKSLIHDQCVPYLKRRRVHFIPLASIGYHSNLSIRRLADHIYTSAALFFTMIVSRRPSVVICSYPDVFCAIASFAYCKIFRVPFILDFRDSWPWLFREYKDSLGSFKRYFVSALVLFLSAPCSYLLRNADMVATMMPSYLELIYSNLIGRKPNKHDLFLPLGSPSLHKPVLSNSNSSKDSSLPPLHLVFIGSLNNTYAPFIIRDFIDICIKKKISDLFRITIAGDGAHYYAIDKLFTAVPNVSVIGYVDNSQISELLVDSDVGLLYQNSQVEALPNKLYTYLSAGIPVLHNVPGSSGDYISSFPHSRYCDSASSLVSAMYDLYSSIEQIRTSRYTQIELFNKTLSSTVLSRSFYEHISTFICDKI